MQYTPTTVPDSTLLDRILRSYYLVCFIFIMLSVAPLLQKNVRPGTVVDLCLLPTWRLTVTTVKGSLVLLDQLEVLVSNIGSL